MKWLNKILKKEKSPIDINITINVPKIHIQFEGTQSGKERDCGHGCSSTKPAGHMESSNTKTNDEEFLDRFEDRIKGSKTSEVTFGSEVKTRKEEDADG